MFRSKALRPIAGVVLITFTALTLQPLTAAAQLAPTPLRAQASSDSGEERFSRTLNEIHEILKEVVPAAAMPHRFRSTASTAPGKPGEKVLQAIGPKMHLESERVKSLPKGHGYDASTGKFGDMIQAGLGDPAKVTRSALQNASSIASMVLTTEALIAEKPEKERGGGGMPPGGMPPY